MPMTDELETLSAPAAANVPLEEESFADLLAQHESVQAPVRRGQQVVGTVVDVAGDQVFVNIGAKIEGVMELADFVDNEGNCSVQPGDQVEAWITRVSAQEIRLAKSMSGAGMAAIECARDNATPVEGRVTAACKGGYHVEILGKQAFCPGSQLPAGQGDAVIGQTLPFLVLRVDGRNSNIVVSHRALLDRQRDDVLARLLEDVHEGDVVEGTVVRLAPFGAFVELVPGVEGMVHLTELSWSRVMHAEEVLQPGDTVQAKVLKIGTEKGRDGKEHTRIALSIKAAQANPWDSMRELQPGTVVEGKVLRLAPFGAFVELVPGVEGLVHLSEMSWSKRVARPDEVVQPGQIVRVKIREINPEARRVSLSLREVDGDPWANVESLFPVGAVVQGTVENRSKFGIFVSLAPGITGLLPEGILRQSKEAAEYHQLEKEAPVTLEVRRVDPATRRITLVPVGMPDNAESGSAPRREREGGEGRGSRRNRESRDDRSWRQHQKTDDGAEGAFGSMAQALQDAMQHRD